MKDIRRKSNSNTSCRFGHTCRAQAPLALAGLAVAITHALWCLMFSADPLAEQYMHENTDDSPLYVFDSSFDEDSVGKSMLSSFEVPFYFRDDLFSLVGEARRPPYRWFLVGPERSGSNLHIDPLATSAWNTLISGVKRWVMYD